MKSPAENKKRVFVTGLQLIIALFFILGPKIPDPQLRELYSSYFADLFLPFEFYFLLTIAQIKTAILNRWWVKALTVFGLCTLSEILQYFGIYALAVVFDPVDILMYAAGVLLAALLDRVLLTRILPFWD